MMLIGALLKFIGMILMGCGVVLEFCEFPPAIPEVIEAAIEAGDMSQMSKVIGEAAGGAEEGALTLLDELKGLTAQVAYSPGMASTRNCLGGALMAILGYSMVLEGEMYQDNAG